MTTQLTVEKARQLLADTQELRELMNAAVLRGNASFKRLCDFVDSLAAPVVAADTPVEPMTFEKLVELMNQLEQEYIEVCTIHAEYQGKAMPDTVYDRFATLRDDSIPAKKDEVTSVISNQAVREQIRESLSSWLALSGRLNGKTSTEAVSQEALDNLQSKKNSLLVLLTGYLQP